MGAQSAGVGVDETVAYARSSYRSLFERGALTTAELRGARVLELGPGDNLGLALQLADDGADEVVCVDRFEVGFDAAKRDAIHAAVVDGEPSLDRVRLLSGVPVEAAAEALSGERFEIVVSIATLEYVEDHDAAFDAMDELLAPGGRMLHQVDLSDHGLLSGAGHDPLTWLTVGDRTYRAMTSNVAAPNRRLVDDYRRALDRLRYEYSIEVTQRLDVDPEPTRPRLLPRYRALSSADLLSGSIFVTARKPPPRARAESGVR